MTSSANECEIDWSRGVVEPVHAALARAADRWPEACAIDFLGATLTWSRLSREVNKIAAGLAALGVREGDRVALLLPNTPYFVIAYYAIARLGATVVNLNPLHSRREVLSSVRASGAATVITLDLELTQPNALACLSETEVERVVLCSLADALPWSKGLAFRLFKRKEIAPAPRREGCLRWSELAALGEGETPPEVDIDPCEAIAVLQFTGGTTGAAKAAMLSHVNVVTNAAQAAAIEPICAQGGDVAQKERVLAVLPLFHVFAMTVAMNLAVRLGAMMILAPRFDVGQTLSLIDAKKPTIFPAVPSVFRAIDLHPEVGRYDLSSVRACISGGAPLPLEVKHAFERRTGCTVVEGYGLTESAPVVSCNPFDRPAKDGAVGLPLPGVEISARDPDDPSRERRAGQAGEICVRGPNVMNGYWRDPEATRATFHDGWLRTGDVGFVDEDGFWWLIDRIKDIILVNGYNVYPSRIEEVLYEHPAIAEATVIAIDDPKRGQAPKAFVVLREGYEAFEIDDLRAFSKERLSPIEAPREIEIRDALPKTMIGKLSKKELVEEERAKREPRPASAEPA